MTHTLFSEECMSDIRIDIYRFISCVISMLLKNSFILCTFVPIFNTLFIFCRNQQIANSFGCEELITE